MTQLSILRSYPRNPQAPRRTAPLGGVALLLLCTAAVLASLGCTQSDPVLEPPDAGSDAPKDGSGACEDVTCNTPPPARCEGSALLSFAGGTCALGVCSYDEVRSVCENGCEGGACIDDFCEANERVSTGTCIACDEGEINDAGDDPSGADTSCDPDACSTTLGVSCVRFEEAYLKASNARTIDLFGLAISLDGDTLAVSAINEPSASTGINGDQADDSARGAGAVYVFRRGDGTWAQEAYIKASNAEEFDTFGTAIALDNDTLVVSAQGESSAASGINGDEDDNSVNDSGAVYVFRREGSTWSQEAYIKASNPGEDDIFGLGVALEGDTLVVGAPSEDSSATGINGEQDDDMSTDSGAVYVYRREAGVWSQEAYIKASNADAGDGFGGALCLDGGTLIVSATGEDSASIGLDGDASDNSMEDSGAAYVFRRGTDGWTQEAYIKPSNPRANDGFGSPALDGDTLVVSAFGADAFTRGPDGGDGPFNTGTLYIFELRDGTWTQEALLQAPGVEAGDAFGVPIALSGDTLAVGAAEEDGSSTGLGGDPSDNSAPFSGAVHLYRRTSDGWQYAAYLKAPNTDATDQFGISLALEGDTLVVGAWNESSSDSGVNGDATDNSADRAGAAYAFRLEP